ncbi:CNNM domain-containing protein [Persephonella sp.]
MDLILKIGFIFVLLLLSAFFAGIESSFFSMDWLKIKRMAKEENKAAKVADYIRSKPKELVVTFLIGNELMNITASAVTSGLVIHYLGKEYLFVAIIIMTILILTFGEITPKTVGSYYPEKYALFAARPFYLFYIIITPFRFVFTKLAEYLLRKAGLELPVESHKLSEDDLLSIISVGTEKKIFTEEEKEIIESALELHKVSVSEIMTPRRDIFAIEKGKTVI